MNVALAERMLLDAGKSSELANVFRVIADAECDGVLKFSPALCREVARTIVCRTYAPPLLVQSGPRIAKDELIQALSGKPVDTLLRNSRPVHRATFPLWMAPPPKTAKEATTALSGHDGFGPPQP